MQQRLTHSLVSEKQVHQLQGDLRIRRRLHALKGAGVRALTQIQLHDLACTAAACARAPLVPQGVSELLRMPPRADTVTWALLGITGHY